MSNITANDVAALRDITGAGIMDCKDSLIQANGDTQLAYDILRKKGIAKLEKKANRLNTNGSYAKHVYYHPVNDSGFIEVATEIYYSNGDTTYGRHFIKVRSN